jgi:hypothetical protein
MLHGGGANEDSKLLSARRARRIGPGGYVEAVIGPARWQAPAGPLAFINEPQDETISFSAEVAPRLLRFLKTALGCCIVVDRFE